MSDIQEKTGTHRMNDDVVYRAHSMIHKAVVQMEPTKLELLDGFEKVDPGYKYVPQDTNVRIIITGRDWSEKRFLVYGCKSSEEVLNYIEMVLERVKEIGHCAKLVNGPEVTNIAVSGDFGEPQQLEKLAINLQDKVQDIEYEPEQFPAVIVKFEDPSVTFLIFSTGKFSIQGLQNMGEIEPQITRIFKLL
jgi:TATA-box binding protein (TBP) (component of TFIID and TFIIIB)